MEEKTVKIPNISCPHCIRTRQNELKSIPGVVSVDAYLDSKKLTVQWKSPATWETIMQVLEDIGYPPGR